METGSPRKIQFTVPLLDSHLDPEAAEQIRRRRPTPATLVASSDQSSPEIDEDRLPNQLYKAEEEGGTRESHHERAAVPCGASPLSAAAGGDECSSESCLSDRPSPDAVPAGEELPEDEEGWSTGDKATSEAFEKLRCQMEEFSRESLLEASGGMELPLSEEKMAPSMSTATLTQNTQPADSIGSAPEKTQKSTVEKEQ